MQEISLPTAANKAILSEIPVQNLHPAPYQPRRLFSQEGLNALAQTIQQLGVLEPLLVKPLPGGPLGCYEIVAGERRWRAARQIGLATVPCLIRAYTDAQAAQAALIENLCREALNPIDEACAVDYLIEAFDYTHEEVAAVIGLHRSEVTNLLRLLRLDARLQEWMRHGELSLAHGKILAGVPITKQYALGYDCVKQGWSMRMLDKAIKTSRGRQEAAEVHCQETDSTTVLAQQLSHHLGFPAKLSLRRPNGQSGHLRIDFADEEQMHKLLIKLGLPTES
jgi:ParB family chromosome partitioning protein